MALRSLMRGALRFPLTPAPAPAPTPSRTLQLLGRSRPFASSSRALRAPAPNATHAHAHSPLVPKPQTSLNRPAKNNHQFWYREVFPSMIPIFVLSTAIFLALSLIRTHLSHNKSLEESRERIDFLETQLAKAKLELKRRQERERRERERMLPLVVERVLQRVGAMEVEEEPVEEEEDVRLVV